MTLAHPCGNAACASSIISNGQFAQKFVVNQKAIPFTPSGGNIGHTFTPSGGLLVVWYEEVIHVAWSVESTIDRSARVRTMEVCAYGQEIAIQVAAGETQQEISVSSAKTAFATRIFI